MTMHPLGGPEYLSQHTGAAVAHLFISSVASFVGTFGNLLILTSVIITKSLRTSKNVFIINVAAADLIITAFAHPLGIIGLVLGKQFFLDRPALCDLAACACLTSCTASLLSIGGTCFNSYIHICHDRVLSLRTNALLCILFWVIGICVSLPPLLGWSDTVYDHKLLACIWDRTASMSFNMFFSVVLIFIPTGIIAASFLKIFLHVRASKRRIQAMNSGSDTPTDKGKSVSTRLARSLFIIFAIFVFCWAPYAILVLVDFGDNAPHEVHLFIFLLAHKHASVNFIVHWATNTHFRNAYKYTLNLLICKGSV